MKAITLRSGTKIRIPKAIMEYEEKKKEGEKEQYDERVKTPKEPEVKVENKTKLIVPSIQPYEPTVLYP